MNPLRTTFADAPARGRPTLLPYITAGYPDVATTTEILERLDPARVACVELGVPFSDPIADGPVIQASFAAALDRGFQVDALLEAISGVRGRIAVPLVAMVSYSIVFRRGPRRFVAAARASGVDGLIVPDLAFEEAAELSAIGGELDCPLVLMIAPTTAPERRPQIATLSAPFIYYQSLAGVTGERASLPPGLAGEVAALRAATAKPICVGFGISTAEQVRAVCAIADGAIVGSAIVRRMREGIERGESGATLAERVCGFVHSLA